MSRLKSHEIVYQKNEWFEMAALSVIGDREEQQDSYSFCLGDREGLFVVCDGMGGHTGGAIASSTAAELICKNYEKNTTCDPYLFLHENTVKADEAVASLTNDRGHPLGAGSTLIAVILRENRMYWSSVGDSRIYLIRGKEIVQVTLDHTYRA